MTLDYIYDFPDPYDGSSMRLMVARAENHAFEDLVMKYWVSSTPPYSPPHSLHAEEYNHNNHNDTDADTHRHVTTDMNESLFYMPHRTTTNAINSSTDIALPIDEESEVVSEEPFSPSLSPVHGSPVRSAPGLSSHHLLSSTLPSQQQHSQSVQSAVHHDIDKAQFYYQDDDHDDESADADHQLMQRIDTSHINNTNNNNNSHNMQAIQTDGTHNAATTTNNNNNRPTVEFNLSATHNNYKNDNNSNNNINTHFSNSNNNINTHFSNSNNNINTHFSNSNNYNLFPITPRDTTSTNTHNNTDTIQATPSVRYTSSKPITLEVDLSSAASIRKAKHELLAATQMYRGDSSKSVYSQQVLVHCFIMYIYLYDSYSLFIFIVSPSTD